MMERAAIRILEMFLLEEVAMEDTVEVIQDLVQIMDIMLATVEVQGVAVAEKAELDLLKPPILV